ncbi:ribosome assembly RNA-binding protein YhbY, partial [Staphylococcus gallinarum]
MLTGKQKRFLRSKAHNVDPTFQIGKSGISDNMVTQIKDTLENRELIKIHV